MPQDTYSVASEIGRQPPPGFGRWFVAAILLCWALFQLWYASPLPFQLGFGVFNDTEARAIHLGFAFILAFTTFRASRYSTSSSIPWFDFLFAFLSCFAALYIVLFADELADRMGAPTVWDLSVGLLGLALLLEATRRTLGWPLLIVALVFLTYTVAGPYMPEVIAHKGASLNKLVSHQWLGTEGVFGIALGVSAGFIFLFVAFGALLEKAGAGFWFIQVAFSLLGHLRGGPAKAAVVASGMSGIISGSSIANVVTTGTFTIPLMKRVGFTATKAGAVEVAASTNGQLTPPVMGAAAFLIVEFVGISYLEVIQHALLPSIIAYIALIYIVHLEALKAGMQGLPRRSSLTLAMRLAASLGVFIGLCLLTLVVYYGVGWIKVVAGDTAIWIIAGLLLVGYLGLVFWAAPYAAPDEHTDDWNIVPEFLPTLRSGAYFLLPVVVLVWCLAVERMSPGLAAFWAAMMMAMIVVTHRPLRALLAGRPMQGTGQRGWNDLIEGLQNGSRNMVSIGIATATAGIVVGTVTLTGIGLVMTEFVELISGGNLVLMLIFTALISLTLGLSLPTTANYIVVSSLMAPVIVTLGAEHGLMVPLIAAHLFVFYFGILADDTPPVGLAAYAASAIAQADPIKTGLQGFAYDIRTAILPFMFIFNPQLLLIGIHSVWELTLVVVSAISGMLCFAAATQGFWLTRNRWWESALLLLLAFSLFRPGFWWDEWFPPVSVEPVSQIEQVYQAAAASASLSFDVRGETLEGDWVEKRITMQLPSVQQDKLAAAGLYLRMENNQVLVDATDFDSPAQKAGIDLDWHIVNLVQQNDRPSKYWLILPLFLLLALLAWHQHRRLSGDKG